MVLPRLQRRRYYKLFDDLMRYANARLKVIDEKELIESASSADSAQRKSLDADTRAMIAHETWTQPEVIGDFVRENPAELSDGELNAIALWEAGLSGTFIVDVFPDGVLRFLKGGFAFEVCGATHEPIESFPTLPAIVETTFLPFDGRIVPADYLNVLPLHFNDELLDLLDEQISYIVELGHIVSTADDLLLKGELIRETEQYRATADVRDLSDFESSEHDELEITEGLDDQNDLDDLGEYDDLDDLDDFDEFGGPSRFDPDDPRDVDGLYDFADGRFGQHEGALAGLPWKERANAVEEYLNSELFEQDVAEIMKEGCLDMPIVRDLATLLSYDEAYDLRKFANLIGADPERAFSGEALITDIVACIADENAVQSIVDQMTLYDIRKLEQLAERDGLWEIPDVDVVSLRDLPTCESGLCYGFHADGAITFVMPDEILAQARTLDWDSAIAKAQRRLDLFSFADDTAELRGIVALDDFFDEYRRRHPDGFDTFEDVLEHLVMDIDSHDASFNLIKNKAGEYYLLYYALYQAYEREQGIADNPHFIRSIYNGELGNSLEGLLEMQSAKGPRWLTDEMLEATSLLSWKMSQDASIAFVQYLDMHVPDTYDDFLFAEDVVETLVEETMWGSVDGNIDTEALFEVLDSFDFVPETDQVQDLLDLWVSLCNALPTWPNGGWSSNELAARGFERAPFINPDGSPRKIGRNDPCPCGSGKKYKNCCGM